MNEIDVAQLRKKAEKCRTLAFSSDRQTAKALRELAGAYDAKADALHT